MKFIKKNKFTILAIVIFVILIGVGVYAKSLLVPDEGKAAYGNRLSGIDKYKVSNSLYSEIESKLKENTNVLSVSHYAHGKIINIIVTLADEVNIVDAKSIGNSIIPMFGNELEYYSLQVYLKKDNEALNNFPIIGYKDIEAKELKFTADRNITTSEDNADEK